MLYYQYKLLAAHVFNFGMKLSFKTHLIALNWMLFIVLVIHAIYFNIPLNYTDEIAIYDAGSSGTRIHIFRLENSKIEEINKGYHTKPGISSINEYIPYFKPFAEYVKQNAFNGIPNYVLATAGMRLLPDKNVTDKFTKIKSALIAHNLVPNEVRIISGEEEGLYGFLSTLDLSHIPSNKLAVLDMGGASLQLSFVEKSQGTVKTSTGTEDLSIFSHSWLGFGRDQAKLKLDRLLTSNHTICGVFNPCAIHSLDNKCIIPQVNIPKCRVFLKSIVKTKECVSNTLCKLDKPIHVPDNLSWYGASEFHYALSQLMNSNHINVIEARKAAELKCKTDKTFDCFSALWTLEILDILSVQDIYVPLEINNNEMTWTRGFAVHYFFQKHHQRNK